MKVCPRCNAQNSDNATNCTNCGFNFMQNPQHQPMMPQQPIPQAQINPQTAYYYGMKEQKKKARKTRWIIFGVIVGILFFIFVIGAASSSDSGNTSNNATANSTIGSGEVTTQKNNTGSYNVEVKSAKLAKDVSDNPIIVVTYSFTNNSDDSIAFDTIIDDKAFQDGVELGFVYTSWGVDGLDFETKRKEIKPGVTYDVTCAYELNDQSTPVDIELYRYFKDEPFYKYRVIIK